MEEKFSTHKWTYIVVLSILILLLSIFFFSFQITEVEVKGNTYYTDQQIKDYVIEGIFDKNSVLLYAKYRHAGLKEIPFVQKVTVTKQGNHKIIINVYEKSLIACVKYMGQYICFDKDGIVLECSENLLEGVPYIEGVRFSGFFLFEKLKVEDEAVFNQILNLSQLLVDYKLVVEHIRLTKEKEVILKSGNIKVLLGNQEFYDEQLVALTEIFPKALKNNLGGEIDMKNYSVGDEVILKQRDF